MNEMVCKKDAGKTEIKHPGGIPIDLVIPPRFDNEDQLKNEPFTLESAVGSQKSAQALGAPGKIKKCRITTEVPTNFFFHQAHQYLPRLFCAQLPFLGSFLYLIGLRANPLFGKERRNAYWH